MKLKIYFNRLIFCKLFGHKKTKCVDLDGEVFIACLRCKTFISVMYYDEHSQEWVE